MKYLLILILFFGTTFAQLSLPPNPNSISNPNYNNPVTVPPNPTPQQQCEGRPSSYGKTDG